MQNEVAGPVVSCAISDGYHADSDPADSDPEVCTGQYCCHCTPAQLQLPYSCSPVQLQLHAQLLIQVQIRNKSILNQSRTVKDKVSKKGTNGHLWHSKAYSKRMSSACIGQGVAMVPHISSWA